MKHKILNILLKKRRCILSREELNTLLTYTPKSKQLIIARDILLFSYYSRLTFKIIQKLVYSSLIVDDEGEIWIKQTKLKENQFVVFQLCNKAKQILENYIPSFNPDNTVPLFSG